METHDLVILGSGSTAFAAAIRASKLGRTAAMTEPRNLSPEALGGTSVRVNLIVPNPDAVAARAVAAGAKVLFPVEDQPYGFRQGRVVDPFGHHWLYREASVELKSRPATSGHPARPLGFQYRPRPAPRACSNAANALQRS
jgi:hypothetical protein